MKIDIAFGEETNLGYWPWYIFPDADTDLLEDYELWGDLEGMERSPEEATRAAVEAASAFRFWSYRQHQLEFQFPTE